MNIKDQKKRQREILNETIDWYSASPERRRSLNAYNSCLYTNGRARCAVGRCMTRERLREVGGFEGDIEELIESFNVDDIDYFLKSKYKGIQESFWVDLQGFHDDSNNWREVGLSMDGSVMVNEIRKNITSGRYCI